MINIRRRFRPRDGRDVLQAFRPDQPEDQEACTFQDIKMACHNWLMKRDPTYRAETERNREIRLRGRKKGAAK